VDDDDDDDEKWVVKVILTDGSIKNSNSIF